MPAGPSSSRGLGRPGDGAQRPPQPRFLTLPRVDPPRDLEGFAHERLLFAAEMDKVEGGGRGSHTRHLGTARRVVLVVDCFLVVCADDGVVAGVMPVEEMSPDVTVQSVVLEDGGGRRRRTQHQLMLESSRQGCFLLQQTDGTNAIERLLYVIERIHEEVFDRSLRVTEAPPDVDLARGVYIKPPAVVRRLFTSAWQPYVVLVADEDAEDDVDTTTDGDSRGPPAGGRPRTQQHAEWGDGGGGGGGGGKDAYPTRSSARGSQAGLGARPGSLMKSPRSRAGSVHETRQPYAARPQQQQQQQQPQPRQPPQPQPQPQPPHTDTFDRERDREEFTRLGGGLGNADLADDEEEIIEIVRKVRRRPGSPARANHPSRLSTAAPATPATTAPSTAAAAAASAPTRRNPLADDDGSNGSEDALLFDERGSPLAALREGWVKDEFWRSYNDALERRAPLPTRRRADAPSGTTTRRAAPAHVQTRTRPPRAVYEGRQWWAGEPSTDADSSAAASTASQRSSPGVTTTYREYRSGGGGGSGSGPRSVHERKRACLDTAELVMDKVEKLSVDIEQARRRLDSTSSRYPGHNSSAKPSRSGGGGGGGGGAAVVQPRTDEPTPWGAYVADWNPTSQWAWDGGLDQRR
eukprot:Rhum_TRINITY_DN15436_c7_g1::Rhum_TRINITY_DN15436_c7_g1_i1::g.157007::m.157007